MKILLLLATAIFSSLASDKMCTASPSDIQAKTWEIFAGHSCTNITGYDGFKLVITGNFSKEKEKLFEKWFETIESLIDVDILIENSTVPYLYFKEAKLIQANWLIVKNSSTRIRFTLTANVFFKKEFTVINGGTYLGLPKRFKTEAVILWDNPKLTSIEWNDDVIHSADNVATEFYVKTLDISANNALKKIELPAEPGHKIGVNRVIIERNPILAFGSRRYYGWKAKQMNEDFSLIEDKFPIFKAHCNPLVFPEYFEENFALNYDNQSEIGKNGECCNFNPLDNWSVLIPCRFYYGSLLIKDQPKPADNHCASNEIHGDVYLEDPIDTANCIFGSTIYGNLVTKNCHLEASGFYFIGGGKLYKPNCSTGTYDEEPPVITVKPRDRNYNFIPGNPGETGNTQKPPIAGDKTTVSTGGVDEDSPDVNGPPDGGSPTGEGAGGGTDGGNPNGGESPSSPNGNPSNNGNDGGSPNGGSPLGASLYGSNSGSSETQTKKEEDNSGTIVAVVVTVLLVIILGGLAAVIFYLVWKKKKGKAGGDKKKKNKDSNKTEQSKKPAKSKVSVAEKGNTEVSTAEKGVSEAERGTPKTPTTPSSAGSNL